MSTITTTPLDVTDSPARIAFRSLVDEMGERTLRRSTLVRNAEHLEHRGAFVVWFQGLPLPTVDLLADADTFALWLGDWTESERAGVAGSLVSFLEELSVKHARLALQETSEMNAPQRGRHARELAAIDQYVAHLDRYFSRIVENVDRARERHLV